jgi:hypothetical protein
MSAITMVKECVHAWVLEEARGRARVPATCRRCGAERTFVADGDVALSKTKKHWMNRSRFGEGWKHKGGGRDATSDEG